VRRRLASSTAALVLAAAVVTAPPGLAAQDAPPRLVERVTTVERIVPAGYGGELTLVGGPRGDVRVTGWRGQVISLVARITIAAPTEQDIDKLAELVGMGVEEGGVAVAVNTTGPHDKATMKKAKRFPKALATMPYRVDYTVRVPEYTSVQLGVVDGDVEVAGVYGEVDITSVHGAVSVRNVGGFTKVTAVDGNVALATADRTWRGGGTDIATANGNISFEAPAEFGAELDAKARDGVWFEGARVGEEGKEVKGTLGRGGSRLRLAAPAGSITLRLAPMAESVDSSGKPRVFEPPRPPN
jgi:hypothetical protein